MIVALAARRAAELTELAKEIGGKAFACDATKRVAAFWNGCARCMASRARTLRRNSTAKAAPARPPRLSARRGHARAAWRRTSLPELLRRGRKPGEIAAGANRSRTLRCRRSSGRATEGAWRSVGVDEGSADQERDADYPLGRAVTGCPNSVLI
jgi:hypothetical protein